MSQQRRQWKIYQDEIKTRQTAHWDLDYLPTAEYEALMAGQRDREEAVRRRAARRWLGRVAAVGAMAVAAGFMVLIVL